VGVNAYYFTSAASPIPATPISSPTNPESITAPQSDPGASRLPGILGDLLPVGHPRGRVEEPRFIAFVVCVLDRDLALGDSGIKEMDYQVRRIGFPDSSLYCVSELIGKLVSCAGKLIGRGD
jgi:hypothetical protein